MADFASGAQLNEYFRSLSLIVEQNLVGIPAVMLVVFHRRLGIQITRHPGHYVKTRRHPQTGST